MARSAWTLKRSFASFACSNAEGSASLDKLLPRFAPASLRARRDREHPAVNGQFQACMWSLTASSRCPAKARKEATGFHTSRPSLREVQQGKVHLGHRESSPSSCPNQLGAKNMHTTGWHMQWTYLVMRNVSIGFGPLLTVKSKLNPTQHN